MKSGTAHVQWPLYKSILYSAVIILTLLVCLELAARLIERNLSQLSQNDQIDTGWQATFFASMFTWHEPDPDLLWRFRAGLDNPLIRTNRDHFIGSPVRKSKDPDSYRILLLGDSSPVGIGLESYRSTFGELLKFRLQQAFLGERKVELINAAVSGYSSDQCRRLLELHGWQYEPDLVLLYCGNNDASISGLKSDQELLESQRFVATRRLFSNLALYRVMHSLFVGTIAGDNALRDSLVLRTTYKRFGENLQDIARQCEQHDCPLVVLKPPVPYVWPACLQFAIFTHITGNDGQLLMPPRLVQALGRDLKYCLDDKQLAEKYTNPDPMTVAAYERAYHDSLTPSNAIQFFHDLISIRPSDPVVLNNLGVSYWQFGDYVQADSILMAARDSYVARTDDLSDPYRCSLGAPILFNIGVNLLTGVGRCPGMPRFDSSVAFEYLDSALQADYFSLRIKNAYWDEIDRLKRLTGVTVVDLPRIFEEHGGERLFVDQCHPNAEGHRLITDELMSLLEQSKQLLRKSVRP